MKFEMSVIMYLIGITIVYLTCIGDYLVVDADIPGYYWRDFMGEIPDDALRGGMENGSKTLIGQVLHKELLIPAKIILEEKKAYYEWGGAECSASENIKILCTNHPEQFEWVKTTSHDFLNIKGKHFVVGGYEPNATLYIGRTYSDGETILGKVLVNEYVVLHISNGGKGVPVYIFEVLAYRKNKPEKSADAPAIINRPDTSEKRPVTVNFYF